MIKFWCVCPHHIHPPPPFPLSLQSVAAVGISGRNQNTLLHVLLLPPPVNPIAIRNIRANHFANVTRPQFCCVCGWKRGGGISWLLLSLRVPYFILIYSVVHAYFRYGLPRRIHAFPSGWLGSFGSTIAWLQQLPPLPPLSTVWSPCSSSLLSALPAQWLAYDLLFKVETPPSHLCPCFLLNLLHNCGSITWKSCQIEFLNFHMSEWKPWK